MRELRMVNGQVTDATDLLPWCPECESYAVPDADGNCGECGTAVVYREGDR